MKIKELKRILNNYDEDIDVYLEFPARYKAIDADRVEINNIVVDIVPLGLVLLGHTKAILLVQDV